MKFILRRYGLSPNQKGSTGTPLFHELIAQLRECSTGDARPMCVHSDRLVGLYLSLGADPDMPFTTGEWEPMPVWR